VSSDAGALRIGEFTRRVSVGPELLHACGGPPAVLARAPAERHEIGLMLVRRPGRQAVG
jgi:hypothetical protein